MSRHVEVGGGGQLPISRLASFTAVCLLLSGPACTQEPATGASARIAPFDRAAPASVGLSEERLREATAALQDHVDAGDIAGVVAAVVRDGKLVYEEALGHRDLEAGEPMTPDALFRMYSMTRPVTALAILMLQDDGLLDVHDPLQRHLPQFADQQVLRDPGSSDPSDTRPREGDVTLAHLLTHTSGIGSRNSGLYRTHDVHRWDRALEEMVDDVAALPLFEDPGTRFRYGMHAEVLARVIEAVSGMRLEEFLEERVFEPLGMTDAVFHVDPSRQDRLAVVYRRDDQGTLRPHRMEETPVTELRLLTSGGVGLVASSMDFLRFSQFLLDEGRVNGRQLLSPRAAAMMLENAVPEALLPLGGSGYWAGSGWSLGGLAVALDPDAYGHGVSRGVAWWDGSAGTRFWIDAEENMITIVSAQVSPASGNGFRERFKDLVYRSIEGRDP